MILFDLSAGLKLSFVILWCWGLRLSVAQENNIGLLQPTTDAGAVTKNIPAVTLTTSVTSISSNAAQNSNTNTGTSVPTQEITSTTADNNDNLPNDLPTLTGVYTIVPPSVPPTQNAPFMQQSKLPEGTVFIVVGAILGFLALSVLAWRMGVAWSLHRSVKKAAFTQYASDTKAIFRTNATPIAPRASVYTHTAPNSTISLSGIGGTKGGKKLGRSGGTAQTSSNTASLFFSPTAGTNHPNGVNRGSSYFPAGYYSAGSSTPGAGAGPILHHGPEISLSNLSTYSQGYGRAQSIEPSPPDSPLTLFENHRNNHPNNSISNLSQTNFASEQTPRAYLDDMFDGEKAVPPLRVNMHT